MQIHIPTPCHEDWNGMTSEEKGRFCGSCQKIVVDFTDQSAEDIRDYLIANAGQKTCGRFTAQQLSTPLPDFEFVQTVSTARVSWVTKIAAIALFAFSGLLSSCDSGVSEKATIGTMKTIVTDSLDKQSKDTIVEPITLGLPVALPVCKPGKTVKVVDPMVVGEIAPVEPELMGDIMVMPDTVKPVVVPKEEPVMGKFMIAPSAQSATHNP